LDFLSLRNNIQTYITNLIQRQPQFGQPSFSDRESPLISIVIPTYNRLMLVQQAIASIVAQTYSNWELIVVDDGSDDGTNEDICTPDPRIRFLAKKHRGNIAELRNAGVKAGTGTWLAFLDSDDLWVPEKLEIQLRMLLQEGKRWGYGGFELMDEDKKTIPNKAGIFHPYSGWIVKELLNTDASVNVGTLLIQRTLFDEVGGFDNDPTLLFREDYDLVVRLALRSEALAAPQLLMRVREHRNRATTISGSGHDRTVAVYKHFIRSKPEKELAAIARSRMASELAESAVSRLQRKKFISAAGLLYKALVNGDRLRHILSAVRRGFRR
jgi:glycosyltransferase involved in cell wall biosynthesis